MKENTSRIDQSMVITGDIVTSSELIVEGHFHGSFSGKVLTVSGSGSVLGEVKGQLVDCAGRLEGRVETESLKLRAGGCQVGTVVTGKLEVEPGAVLDCILQSGAVADTSGGLQFAEEAVIEKVELSKYTDAFDEENRPCCFEVPWSERFELYKRIRTLLDREKVLIKVVGETGSGKTILAEKLLADSTETQLVVKLEQSVGSVTELLAGVAVRLGLEPGDGGQGELIDAIRAELRDRSVAGQNVVLVIDDAQDMFQATMEGLLRLLSGACGEDELVFEECVQIVLLGTEEMKQNMVATILEYFEDETNCQLTLDPLNMKDTADYLRLGLQMASKGDEKSAISLLPNESIKEIHARSGGAISIINRLVSAGLKHASIRSESCLSSDIVKELADI